VRPRHRGRVFDRVAMSQGPFPRRCISIPQNESGLPSSAACDSLNVHWTWASLSVSLTRLQRRCEKDGHPEVSPLAQSILSRAVGSKYATAAEKSFLFTDLNHA